MFHANVAAAAPVCHLCGWRERMFGTRGNGGLETRMMGGCGRDMVCAWTGPAGELGEVVVQLAAPLLQPYRITGREILARQLDVCRQPQLTRDLRGCPANQNPTGGPAREAGALSVPLRLDGCLRTPHSADSRCCGSAGTLTSACGRRSVSLCGAR